MDYLIGIIIGFVVVIVVQCFYISIRINDLEAKISLLLNDSKQIEGKIKAKTINGE